MINGIELPKIYYDRDLLSDLPDNVAKEIRSKRLTLNGKTEKVSFVGMLMLEGKNYVFIPRSTQGVTSEKTLEHASKTLKVVEKYGRMSETSIDLYDAGDGKINLQQLSLIQALLEDYRQNGIYTKRREVKKLNQGKIDWKRTVNKIMSFPNRSSQPIYIDTHGIKRQYFDNCEIARIHASIIYQLDTRFSWIVTGSLRLIAPELRDFSLPNNNIDNQLSRLTNELSQTYSDRDIKLLKLLIKFLKKSSGCNESNFIAGLEKFHFCWEHMLGKVLKNTVNLNSKLPAPAYIDINDRVLVANEKGMRTDIILHDTDNNRYTVVDAKYYAAKSVGDAPGWNDIVKQLFYEKSLQKLDESALIKNVFIFPGKDGFLKKAMIRDRIKSTKDAPVFIDDFKPVHCYYIDPMEVIGCYLNGNKMEEITKQLLDVDALSL